MKVGESQPSTGSVDVKAESVLGEVFDEMVLHVSRTCMVDALI